MVETEKRLQLNLSRKAVKELEELKVLLDVHSMAEVIRSSIKLTRFMELEKQSGNEIISRNIEKKEEKKIVF